MASVGPITLDAASAAKKLLEDGLVTLLLASRQGVAHFAHDTGQEPGAAARYGLR
jgi:hypothetical protein